MLSYKFAPYGVAALAVLLHALLLQGCNEPPPPPKSPKQLEEPATTSISPPSLFVFLVVDQMKQDDLIAFRPLFRYGLKRLLEEGRNYSQAMHEHAKTETSAGHATIATGVLPAVHGVIDRFLFDRQARNVFEVCDIGPPPCSGEALLVPTFGQRLNSKWPESRTVALSQKG